MLQRSLKVAIRGQGVIKGQKSSGVKGIIRRVKRSSEVIKGHKRGSLGGHQGVKGKQRSKGSPGGSRGHEVNWGQRKVTGEKENDLTAPL